MSRGGTTDVLVVGAGPVGLAAAIRARAAGHDVLVLDRRGAATPIDKACGEGLLPGALAAVRALGVDPPGHDLRGISYRDAHRHADHEFTAGPGRGVRRTALHAALHARALEAGAVVRRGSLTRVAPAGRGVVVQVGDETLRARWLLGCDGLHSTVRRAVGLDVPAARGAGAARYGLRRHYRVAPWSDLVEVHWGERAEAYVTPVAPDVVGVAVLGPRGTDVTLDAFPELAGRLADAPTIGAVRGAGPLRQRTRARTAGAVRLVGDASGYVDALTGEGVRVGLAQAEAAVRHLDDAAAYERAWRAATRDYRALTTGLVAWATSPVRRAIVPVAARSPRLYGAVVDRLAR